MKDRDTGEPRLPVYDLFPVKESSVRTAYSAIIAPYKARKDNSEALSERALIPFDALEAFATTRQSVVKYTDPSSAIPFDLGVSVAYRALREEAQSRGGVLPRITGDIVRTYQGDTTDIENVQAIGAPDSLVAAAADPRMREIAKRIGQEIDGFLSSEDAFRKFFPRNDFFYTRNLNRFLLGNGILVVYGAFKTAQEIEYMKQKFDQ